MKESPEQQNLKDNLEPGAFSAEGFLGTDTRNPADIIRTDQETVDNLGVTHKAIAEKMRELTEVGKAAMGRIVVVDNILDVTVSDAMGAIPCPFRDVFKATKQITQVINTQTGESIHWSDLSIHMVEAHGFYEGYGSTFRIDPDRIVPLIGVNQAQSKPESVNDG